MRVVRSVLFWIHLIAGVAAGVVILIMSATGVLLTYQKQITLWADLRGVEAGPPTRNAARLPDDSLLALVAASATNVPTNIVWRNGEAMPVEVQFGRQGRQYVSAYTGEVVGTGNATVRKVFSVATDWHRWLARKDEGRATGRAITGWSNLAFLVLVLTGMVLWWPRNLTWSAVRNVLWFRRAASPKARDFNWHNVIGIWSAVPLALIVASGAVISFPWASDLVYKAVGEAPPPRQPEGGAASPAARGTAGTNARNETTAPLETPLVGDVRRIAGERMPDWTAMALAWPKNTEAPLVYTIDRGMGGEPTKRATLTISRTGEPAKWVPFDSLSAGRRARSILRFTHTGEVLGVWGQTLAGLVSLGALVLVATGLALSARRLTAFLGRRARVRAPRSGRTASTGAHPTAGSAPAP